MKKVTFALVLALLMSSCTGDMLINRNSLSKNFDTTTKNINLSNMDLTYVPDFSMYGTGEVFFSATSIDLSGNDIMLFDMSDFAKFENLEEIDIHQNQISRILLSNNAIELTTTLTRLDISHNRLKDIGGLKDLEVLKYLDVSNNELLDIDLMTLKGKNTIRYLNLVENPDMSTKRIELVKPFNQKYIDATTPQTSAKKTMSGSVTQ